MGRWFFKQLHFKPLYDFLNVLTFKYSTFRPMTYIYCYQLFISHEFTSK